MERSLDMLHPACKMRFQNLLDDLHTAYRANKIKVWFMPFETYRSPARQARLYRQGRTDGGRIVTQAKAWESAHQYGLAVDFVPVVQEMEAAALNLKPGWNWNIATESDWGYLSAMAAQRGLSNSIPWDRAHVEDRLMFEDYKTLWQWREGGP